MEKIERPKRVAKTDKKALDLENFEQNVEKQLKKIYDKIDEIIEKINQM